MANDKINSPAVYEIFRIIDGVPLFLEDHLDRFISSCDQLYGATTIEKEIIWKAVFGEIHKNESKNGNFKLEPVKLPLQTIDDVKVHPIPSIYPDKSQYRLGVSLIGMDAERVEPNIKRSDNRLRESADQLREKNDCFEVLLIDTNRLVKEGSRSNVFFIRNSSIYTPPLKGVLPGITRKKIIQLAMEDEIQMVEKEIRFCDITDYESIFLTGTSINVLPVRALHHIKYLPDHPLIRRLSNLYEQCISAYVTIRSRANLFN